MILPTAPANFYAPSLEGLRDALSVISGPDDAGRLTFLTAPPTNIETAWAEVGAGHDEILGSLVVGTAIIDQMNGPTEADSEVPGEPSWKLSFGEMDAKIIIDGSGSTKATVVGAALIAGNEFFDDGSNTDVRYIIKVDNMEVTDGTFVTVTPFDIIINYSEVFTG